MCTRPQKKNGMPRVRAASVHPDSIHEPAEAGRGAVEGDECHPRGGHAVASPPHPEDVLHSRPGSVPAAGRRRGGRLGGWGGDGGGGRRGGGGGGGGGCRLRRHVSLAAVCLSVEEREC